MEYEFLAIGLFIIGLLIGSFLNVVIYRLPLGKSVVSPRSACPKCGFSLKPWHNIPVFSYLFLKGKCVSCDKKIPFRYPLVELLTGCLFLGAFLTQPFDLSFWIRDLPFLSILIAIAFIDLDHQIIPDELSLGGLVYGLLTAYFATRIGIVSSLMGAFFGFSVFYALSYAYYKVSGKIGLGGGDIKYLAMAGAFLGLEGVFYTLLLSSLSGAVIGIFVGIVQKEKNLMGMSIPYGPFLVFGSLVYYFIGDFLWLQFTTLM